MRFAIILVLGAAPLLAQGVTWYVPDHFPAVPAAMAGASSGDTVIVRPGVWVGAIDFLGKAIHLKSERGPEATALHGNGTDAVVLFISGEGPGSILEGFRITGGFGAPWFDYAGGVTVFNGASPVIRRNVITGNLGSWGGGVNVTSASPQIVDNDILGNRGTGGGGVCVRTLGGPATPVIARNRIIANSALNPFAGGGGILIDGGSYGNVLATVTGNVIEHNVAEHGGGVRVINAGMNASDNVVSGNRAVLNGGGIEFNVIGIVPPASVLANDLVKFNVAGGNGGGVAAVGIPALAIVNGTLVRNEALGSAASGRGGAVYWAAASGSVHNCILWGNSALLGAAMYLGELGAGSVVFVGNDIVQGGTSGIVLYNGQSTLVTGSGMLASEPLFADAANGDYHIVHGSPARDAGATVTASIPSRDFEGDPRVSGTSVDIGCDEFHPHLYATGSAFPGGLVVVKLVGPPASDPVALAVSTLGLLSAPLPTPAGGWWLAFPILGPFILPQIPGSGILALPIAIDPAFPSPFEIPVQGLVGPVLTNPLVIAIGAAAY